MHITHSQAHFPTPGGRSRAASDATSKRPSPAWVDVIQSDGRPDASTAVPDWSEEEVVLLHWRLLEDVRRLSDPAAPLEEKLDTLRWVFTERDKDRLPFSFVNCLRVVGCSPLSPLSFCGLVDAEELRGHIRHSLKTWLAETLARYPDWVRQALVANPEWIEARLARNPQWINEQIKQMSKQPDLFACLPPTRGRGAARVEAHGTLPST